MLKIIVAKKTGSLKTTAVFKEGYETDYQSYFRLYGFRR